MNFEFRQKPIGLRTALAAVLTATVIGFILVAAFGYLGELVACINIPEEIQNEIPE